MLRSNQVVIRAVALYGKRKVKYSFNMHKEMEYLVMVGKGRAEVR